MDYRCPGIGNLPAFSWPRPMSAMPIPAVTQEHTWIGHAARRGGSRAFLALIGPSQTAIFRTAFRITGNLADAEDVGQETFLKACNGMCQFTGDTRDGRAFAAWVCRIAANESIDTLRRRRKGRLISIDDPLPDRDGTDLMQRLKASADDPEQRYARLELRRMLACEIAQLDPSLRSVCLLRDVAQLSTQETAERLRISSTAVRIRLFRARLKLRERMRQALCWPSTTSKRTPPLAPPYTLPEFACGD
jgi:RNA polymerase sigma-70 factor, ECF subfamily